MTNVSRPLIALLLGTVAVFAVWIVALKPSSSSSGGAGASSQAGLASAITKAHNAVAVSAAASVAHGGAVATPPAAGARPATTAKAPAQPGAAARKATVTATPAHRSTAGATAAHRVKATAAHRVNSVTRALNARKTLALLFYNPAAADDRAVRKELGAIPAHHGRVVRLAVPLSELSGYQVVTTQVMVNASPTLVLIDSAHHASTLVGFADRFEIAQRVADVLASP